MRNPTEIYFVVEDGLKHFGPFATRAAAVAYACRIGLNGEAVSECHATLVRSEIVTTEEAERIRREDDGSIILLPPETE